MMRNNNKLTAIIALGVVMLLTAFGIDRIGGETWVSAAASAAAGFRAGPGVYMPESPSVLRMLLVPLVMIVAIVAVAVLGAILKRLSNRDGDTAAPTTQP